MVAKQEGQAKIVLISAFILAVIVLVLNLFIALGDFHRSVLGLILIIVSVLWIIAITIAGFGVCNRKRYWLFPFLALLYFCILPLLLGFCVSIGMIFDNRDEIIGLHDWRNANSNIQTKICVNLDLIICVSAFIGTGVTIYFAVVLQGYYSALAIVSETAEEPVNEQNV